MASFCSHSFVFFLFFFKILMIVPPRAHMDVQASVLIFLAHTCVTAHLVINLSGVKTVAVSCYIAFLYYEQNTKINTEFYRISLQKFWQTSNSHKFQRTV